MKHPSLYLICMFVFSFPLYAGKSKTEKKPPPDLSPKTVAAAVVKAMQSSPTQSQKETEREEDINAVCAALGDDDDNEQYENHIKSISTGFQDPVESQKDNNTNNAPAVNPKKQPAPRKGCLSCCSLQ